MTPAAYLKTLSVFACADMTVRYRQDTRTGHVGLDLYPTVLQDALAPRPADTGKEGTPAFAVDPLAHVKIAGDPYTAYFAQGRTMRLAPSVDRFTFRDQSAVQDGPVTTVLTTLESREGLRLEHRLAWRDGDRAVQITTRFVNDSSQPVTLEMLTSFSLGGITPFRADDASGHLLAHRFRSVWAAEGRLETQSLEQLHLERSATVAGAYSERFGQVGSMPVRGWFPFAAVEDTAAGVTWGAQLAWAGSWQMEVFRKDDQVCLSGGLADREFGHWTKTLTPGEVLDTPPATLSCVQGGLDDLCDRLTAVQHLAADGHPAVEQDLPIVFNEWCTTWGNPTQTRLEAIAACLQGSPVKYLVIDAGWYCGGPDGTSGAHGDWLVRPEAFPGGLRAAADGIRERGLVPGLWFEAETCADGSAGFLLTDHLLKRDGVPITVAARRFWDLTDPFVAAHLSERMTDLLEDCGIGYLKIDYNETIGLGCDGAESLGEGLRQQTLGLYRLLDQIRERLPDLVIENCASGGHRLEPSLLGRTAMSSFSDAHEAAEIPIIAASLHRLLLPRQSQIWAVLRASDSERRLVYSLAATFLGRMCLSGDIDRLSAEQNAVVRAAERLYQQSAPVIKRGRSRCTEQRGPSWRHPQGWQAVTRISDDSTAALVVAHAFDGAAGGFEAPLPAGGGWTVAGQLVSGADSSVSLQNDTLTAAFDGDFSGRVVLLKRG